MSNAIAPALTPEQWDSRDYRQAARELDSWAKQSGISGGDSTEYVAKLGLDQHGAVIVMNRAHEIESWRRRRRAGALAAFALAEQPFGFSQNDVEILRAAADATQDSGLAGSLRSLAARLSAPYRPRLDDQAQEVRQSVWRAVSRSGGRSVGRSLQPLSS